MKKIKQTKEELYLELLSLKQENADLKAIHEKKISELIQAEEKKHFMLSRLHRMLSSFNYGILVVDENNLIEFINEEFCDQFELNKDITKWTGCKSEDFINYILPSYANPQITYEQIKKIVSDNHPVIGVEVLMRGGQTYLVDFVPLIIDGKSTGRIWLHRNITERKHYEELLRVNHERFTALVGTTMVGLWATDLEGNIFEVNDTYCKMTGYSKEQLLKMNVLDLEYVDSEAQMKKRIETLLSNGAARFETIHKCADGKLINLEVHATLLKEQKNILVFFHDITNRKQSELKLIKLSRAVMQSPVSIIITDPEGNIEYANPKYIQTSGYSLEEIIGKNPRILNSGFHPKEYFEKMWDLILSGNDWAGEICNKNKNDQYFWERSRISPIVNENGDVTNFVEVKEEITEKKKMIDELIIAKEKAEEADRLKSEFLAQLSHEIRTPMNAIINFSIMVNDELKEKINPELVEYLKGIDSASHRLLRTIDLLLNVSEMLTGTYVASFVEIDLIGEILERICSNYATSLEGKNVQFNFVLPATKVLIVGDKYSIYQIFTNLIDNAIKYTITGSISISVYTKEQKPIVCIEDTGIGISEEFISKIFHPFAQEDTGFSKRYEGSGLGLTLIKKYCDLNGIEITVESKKGIGTKFTLRFANSG